MVAEEQTAGQGRHGHSWHSEPGSGIYCSMVLEPAPALTLALGLAARTPSPKPRASHCDLRWPNDVMLGGRKVAGILVQAAGDGRAIAGIGINVNHTSFPPELAGEATSLASGGLAERAEASPALSREDILIALLRGRGLRTSALDRETRSCASSRRLQLRPGPPRGGRTTGRRD